MNVSRELIIMIYSTISWLRYIVIIRFFFSSRRRHTRFSRDWSSDVCSSDLWDLYERGVIASRYGYSLAVYDGAAYFYAAAESEDPAAFAEEITDALLDAA